MIFDQRHRGLANILSIDGSVWSKRWLDITERDFRIQGL
jgi:hypothetical protein